MLASLGHILIASLVMLIPVFDHVAAGSALVAAAGWLLYETIRAGLGLVLVALDMIVRFALAVAGSWLLVVAVADEPEAPTSS